MAHSMPTMNSSGSATCTAIWWRRLSRFSVALTLIFCTTLTKAQTINPTIVINHTVPITHQKQLTFALSPKFTTEPFFGAAGDGCQDRALFFGHECLYVGPETYQGDGQEQADLINELLDNQTVDGLSISVTNTTAMRPVIQKALAQGIPVVTFDTDDPESGRQSYIGTDNYFLGQTLGAVLKKLRPVGGTYVIVSGNSPNLNERERGVRESLAYDGSWHEVPQVSPLHISVNASEDIDLMAQILDTNPDISAMIPTLGAPMFQTQKWSRLTTTHPNTTFVVGDGLPVQLDLLGRGKVHGLVAQMPYEMGEFSVDTLVRLIQSQSVEEFQGTNVLEHLMVPLKLPELIVDHHYLGSLRILGFGLFAVIAATAIGFSSWALIHRKVRVVQVSQPEFLVMIATGALIMGAAMVPLSFDDSRESYTDERGIAICMSIPWLIFMGFTITISALGAKTWRVNRLFRDAGNFTRGQVTVRDVLVPCLVLMAMNVVVLLTWTLVDPIYYVRKNKAGTDPWDRVLGTYGTCVADNPMPYMMTLGVLNFTILILANCQAYQARHIQGDFAESQYIGYCMLAMLQAAVIGSPILVLVKDLPEAWYILLCIMLFMISMVILCAIFIPKILHNRKFRLRSEGSQQQAIREHIQNTQQAIKRERRESTMPRPSASRASVLRRLSQPISIVSKLSRFSKAPSEVESDPPPRPSGTIDQPQQPLYETTGGIPEEQSSEDGEREEASTPLASTVAESRNDDGLSSVEVAPSCFEDEKSSQPPNTNSPHEP